MANKPVKPAVPTIPLSYKFTRIVYKGTPYHLRINLDLNSKNFLKVTEIRYSPPGSIFEQSLVAYSTDAENKAGAKPWEPFVTGGLGKAGTKLFNEVVATDLAKKAVANELSSYYGSVKPEVQKEWRESAARAGTNELLDQIKPGPGVFKPAPDQPPVQSVDTGSERVITPGPSGPSGGPITIPNEIKQLQETADKTIQSLSHNGETSPVVIYYPEEGAFESSQDHVLIEQFTYRAPQEDLLTKGSNTFTSNFSDIVTAGLTRNTNIKKFIGMVKLPIPNQLGISNGVSWGEDKANPIEAASFFGSLGFAQNVAGGDIVGLLQNTFGGFDQLMRQITDGGFGSGTPAGLLLSSFLAQYGLGKVGINVDPAQFIARGTGTTINPNLELLFNGPKLRSFSFSFEFAPNDELDAAAARRVIRFFKQGMAPKKISTNTIFIGSPNVFRVTYRSENGNNIKGLHRHKICALTTCEVNYTPDGMYQSYSDPYAGSQPVRTTMTLSFTELTPIFEGDYYEAVSPTADPSVLDAFNTLKDDKGNIIANIDSIEYHDIGF